MKKYTNNTSGEKVLGCEQYYKKDTMVTDSRIHKNPMYFKNGMTRFCFAGNWDEFYDNWQSNYKGSKLYELIPLEGKLPLYMDIEYTGPEETSEPVDALKQLFLNFVAEKTPNYKLNKEEPFYEMVATRKKTHNERIYWYHSYHLILKTKDYYFKSQPDMKTFLQSMIYWGSNQPSQRDLINKINIKQKDGKIGIIDFGVYNKSVGTHQAFRMPFSEKADGKDILTPTGSQENYDKNVMDNFIDEANWREYFVTYPNRFNDKCYMWSVPQSWHTNGNKIQPPKIYKVPQSTGEIPEYVEKNVRQLFKEYHPNAKFISGGLSSNSEDYIFKFDDKVGKCMLCGRAHPDMTNNNYMIFYKPNGHRYVYTCYSLNKGDGYPRHSCDLNPMCKTKSLLNWDYEYEDTEEVECQPLLPPNEMPEGGTFLLQAPKGTGKSKAMMTMLNNYVDENPKAKILMITYRISLASKFSCELDGLDFHYYQNPITEQSHVDRIILLIDSLHKLVNGDFVQTEYDIIIMDEIFSILEGWNSSLMGHRKLHLMNIFEKLVKKAKWVYLLDANLNNKLVVNTMSILRDSGKFVCHKNPRCYPYHDYTVHWYEPIKRAGKIDDYDKRLWQQTMLNKLIEGKRIGFVSATKSMVDVIESIIKEYIKTKKLPKDFKYLKYTADTDPSTKKKELGNVEEYWKEMNLVLYSPTISAGISYNVADYQFDEQYTYLRTPSSKSASYNTLYQMSSRFRQLNDKNIHVFFDNDPKFTNSYCIEEDDLETQIQRNAETIYESFGKPACEKWGELDKKFKPIFDIDCWEYKRWIECARNTIKFSKPWNFKRAYINAMTNPPKLGGRGMKLRDYSIVSEESQPAIDPNILSQEDIEQYVETLYKEKYQLYKDTYDNGDNETFIKTCEAVENGDDVSADDYRYFCMRKIESECNIDFNKLFMDSFIPDELDRLTLFKSVINFKDLAGLKRQEDYLNEVERDWENFSSFWDFKTIKKSGFVWTPENDKQIQTTSNYWEQNYLASTKLRPIFEALNIDHKYGKSLQDLKIDREVFELIIKDKKKLKSIYDIMLKYFNHTLPQLSADTTKYEYARKFLKDWYEQNDGKHLYDEVKLSERDKFIKMNKLPADVEDFKKNKWKPKTGKNKVDFDTNCKTGKWLCTQWRKVKWDEWTVTILKNYLDIVFDASIGYQFSNADYKKGGNHKWTELKFINKYEPLNAIQQSKIDFIKDDF